MILKFIYIAFSRTYSTLTGLILLLISTELLGFHIRGQVAVSITWVTTLFTILYLSLGQVGYKEVSREKGNLNNVISVFFVYNLIVSLSVTLVSYCLYVFVIVGDISYGYFLFSLIILPAMILEQQLLSLFLVFQNTNKLNIITIKNKTVSLLLSLCIIYIYPSYYSFIICVFMSSFAMSLSLFCNIYNGKLFKFEFQRSLMKSLLKKAVGFHFFNAFGYILYTQAPLLILSKYYSVSEFAKYEIAFKFLALLSIIATSCQLLGMRIFSKKTNIKNAWNQYIKVIAIYFFITFFIVLTSSIIIDLLIEFKLGGEYKLSLETFKDLIPYMPLMSTSLFLPTLFLNFDMLKSSAIYNVILGVGAIISLFYFINAYDGEGVFLALKTIYLFSGVIFVFYIVRIYFLKVKYEK